MATVIHGPEPEVRYTSAECTVPVLNLDKAPEWAALLLPIDVLEGEDKVQFNAALDQLEVYEASLVDSLHTHREMVKALCGEPQ